MGSFSLGGCYRGFDPASAANDDASGDDAASGGRDDDGDDRETLCRDPDVGVSKLRRLTAVQYDHTVRDLFGLAGSFATGFAADERVGPFKSNVAAPVGELQVEQYMDAAEDVASAALDNLAQLLPCDPDVAGEEACARQFIAEVAPKAYRRPVSDDDIDALVAVFEDGRAELDFQNGIRVAIAAMLQSPYFLYHVELGAGGGSDGSMVEATDYEIASRLSYFLWNTMPDDELFEAAAAGELRTDGGIAAQVDRMLEDPRAADAIESFHLQWLGIDEMERVEKTPELFPNFTRELALAMKEDTAAFVRSVVLDGDGSLETLLTASYTLSDDPELLALYGVEPPADHEPGEPLALPPDERAGLLTQPSVLARHAHANQTSPILRGVLLRQNFFCQILPPPPPDVDNVPPDPDPDATTRERFAVHTENPSCAGCHVLIDPLGFGLENYDAVGAFRTKEGDLDVDASGELVSTDVNGEFEGGVALAHAMARSEDVQECVARQWFRFATGRAESDADACTIEHLRETFIESGQDVRVLLRELALSDAFRYRKSAAAEGGQ